jgi:hypothetical protein
MKRPKHKITIRLRDVKVRKQIDAADWVEKRIPDKRRYKRRDKHPETPENDCL